MNDSEPRRRRADTLRVPLKSGKWDFVHTTHSWPRWTIGDIAEALLMFAADYDPEKVGCEMKRFTKREVAAIAHWVLYKQRPPWDGHELTLNPRQKAFFDAYLSVGGFNAARAARIAGYSPRRAKQTGHELLRKVFGR